MHELPVVAPGAEGVAHQFAGHPGHDGHFHVMTITGRDVAYAVAQVSGRLIEAGDESAVMELRFDQIGALALSRAESKTLIEQTMRTYQ